MGDAERAELVADGVGAAHGDAGADALHGAQDAHVARVPGVQVRARGAVGVRGEEVWHEEFQAGGGVGVGGGRRLEGAEGFDAVVDGADAGGEPVHRWG